MRTRETNRQSAEGRWPIIVVGLLVLFLAVVGVLRNSFSPYIRSWTVKAAARALGIYPITEPVAQRS